MDDEPKKEEAKLTAEAPEQGAIRGAFFARVTLTVSDTAGGGGFESGAATEAMRGAYLRHLGEKPSGAVVGDEAGDSVLRSIYAARTAPAAAAPARKGRARPAKAAKKKRAAAPPRRKAKRVTAPKRVAVAKRAKPAKRAKKAGRKMRRR